MAEFEVSLSEKDIERLSGAVAEQIQGLISSGEIEGFFVPPLLAAKQVAEILQRPLTAVQSLIAKGEIPAVRFGEKTIRVDPRDLDAYIKAHADDPDRRRRLAEWTSGAVSAR